jgi:hypothetical protein
MDAGVRRHDGGAGDPRRSTAHSPLFDQGDHAWGSDRLAHWLPDSVPSTQYSALPWPVQRRGVSRLSS